jgi:hypothetical protein
MQQLLTIQKYAAKHHISIFNVIKKTMSGELPTVVKEENGKEVTYIVMDSTSIPSTEKIGDTSTAETTEIDYKKAYEDLHKEYLMLKTKYQRMVDMLEG